MEISKKNEAKKSTGNTDAKKPGIISVYGNLLEQKDLVDAWTDADGIDVLEKKIQNTELCLVGLNEEVDEKVYIKKRPIDEKEKADFMENTMGCIKSFHTHWILNKESTVSLDKVDSYIVSNNWALEQIDIIQKDSHGIFNTWIGLNTFKCVTDILSLTAKGGIDVAFIIRGMSVLLDDYSKMAIKYNNTIKYHNDQISKMWLRINALKNGNKKDVAKKQTKKHNFGRKN